MGLDIYYSSAWHTLPTPSDMPVGDELVWGSNTGRNSSGTMIGDFKGYKTTIEVSWRHLTLNQMQTIRNAIRTAISENPFFKIRYTDVENPTFTDGTHIVYSRVTSGTTSYYYINEDEEEVSVAYSDLEKDADGNPIIALTDNLTEKTVYVSDMPRSIYSLAEGSQFYTDTKLTFIEK